MAVRGVEVERRGGVAWIVINNYQATVEASLEDPDFVPTHHGLALALDELRFDDEVRVVVITGRDDGEFYRVCRWDHYEDVRQRSRLNPHRGGLHGGSGYFAQRDLFESLLFIDKPVIARVNGDAIGLGQSVLWGCDLIIAREDALISDVHTGQGDVRDSAGEVRGFPWAVAPGDGAMSVLPTFLTPTKLKEYMFLSKVWSAKELADLGAFNYAVPAAELDALVDKVVEDLLARPDFVLAQTKRICNKHLVNQWNLSQDLATAYEFLGFWKHGALGNMD